MAIHTQSGSTVANTVLPVIFNSWNSTVEIINRGTTDIWFRTDKIDPTIAGDDCHFVAANSWVDAIRNGQVPSEPATGIVSTTEVRLISSAIVPFTIEVQQ